MTLEGKRFSKRLQAKTEKEEKLVASQRMKRIRESLHFIPKLGSRIDVWFNLDDCGVWWGGEIVMLHIPEKYPNQSGIPPSGEKIEVEVSENVFFPGVVSKASYAASPTQRMVVFEDEQSLVDFSKTTWRWCHKTVYESDPDVKCNGRICFDPMPDFGYPCPVYGKLQFLSGTELIPDDLPATIWRHSQGSDVKLEPLVDDEPEVHDENVEESDDDFPLVSPVKKRKVPKKKWNSIKVEERVAVLETQLQSRTQARARKSKDMSNYGKPFSCREEVRNHLLHAIRTGFDYNVSKTWRVGEGGAVDGQLSTCRGTHAAIPMSKMMMKELLADIVKSLGSYENFQRQCIIQPSLSECIYLDDGSDILLLAFSFAEFCGWFDVLAPSTRSRSLLRYSENHSRQLGTKRSLLQILGFAIEGDEHTPSVIVPGHSALSRNVSCEEVALTRKTSTTVNGEFVYAMEVNSISIQEIASSRCIYHQSGETGKLDITDKQFLGLRWTPIGKSKKSDDGAGAHCPGFLSFLLPIVTITGNEEPERVYKHFSQNVIDRIIRTDSVDRECAELLASLQ